jgi:hypothetical protein
MVASAGAEIFCKAMCALISMFQGTGQIPLPGLIPAEDIPQPVFLRSDEPVAEINIACT